MYGAVRRNVASVTEDVKENIRRINQARQWSLQFSIFTWSDNAAKWNSMSLHRRVVRSPPSKLPLKALRLRSTWEKLGSLYHLASPSFVKQKSNSWKLFSLQSLVIASETEPVPLRQAKILSMPMPQRVNTWNILWPVQVTDSYKWKCKWNDSTNHWATKNSKYILPYFFHYLLSFIFPFQYLVICVRYPLHTTKGTKDCCAKTKEEKY